MDKILVCDYLQARSVSNYRKNPKKCKLPCRKPFLRSNHFFIGALVGMLKFRIMQKEGENYHDICRLHEQKYRI